MSCYLVVFRLGESGSYVAAVLFKIEAAGRLGYTCQACTDIACKWNVSFVKKVQPAPLAAIAVHTEGTTTKLVPQNAVMLPVHTESDS